MNDSLSWCFWCFPSRCISLSLHPWSPWITLRNGRLGEGGHLSKITQLNLCAWAYLHFPSFSCERRVGLADPSACGGRRSSTSHRKWGRGPHGRYFSGSGQVGPERASRGPHRPGLLTRPLGTSGFLTCTMCVPAVRTEKQAYDSIGSKACAQVLAA